jgi:hypothetical protein
MHKTLILSSLIVAAPAAGQVQLIGVEFRDGSFSNRDARLFDIDPVTGAASNPRFTDADVVTGIAQGPDGTLFALTDGLGTVNNEPAGSSLLTIDIFTGETTIVGDTGIFLSEGDLDFDADGNLFAVTTENGVATLLTLDADTGAGQIVGTIPGLADASAMAFAPDGSLYVLDTTVNAVSIDAFLVEVDPTDASVLSSVTITQGLGNTAGIDFNPADGTLFLADGDFNGTNNLYIVDLTTGDLITVGTTIDDNFFGGLAGLEFAVIPEPTTLSLLGLGSLALLRRR